MSMSNSNVAQEMFSLYEHRPVQHKTYTGSNFRVERNSNPLIAGFTTIASAVSYRTEVARLVHNDNAFDPGLSSYELWLDSHRYSPTTDRQISHIMSALYSHNTSRIARGLPPIASYSFPFSGITHRLLDLKLGKAIMRARANRAKIIQKGLRQHTRQASLADAIYVLEDAISTTTRNVPESQIELYFARTVIELGKAREFLDMLRGLQDLPVPDLRVAVSAMITLEKY